ncbi:MULTISPECIES: pyruvate kinase [unclassified Actinomyces]|uniref:pyruvate kinase n=1 Tax=unclassified Actinomyces TaxID=2609248 RepID=UPI002017FD26|nr:MULTISPECIES: pyruvate kinase [unclassified Actinomyces]MCL3777512.1 pyruvate kinase [Actinomyces sp. AC-20-1]MCL3790088.1 pyruvate kinase [Actinomyces sp. 187325]MCL3792373.1 pyruvate kinase [Actinomyces sp. 186855]MCL3794121.1 pyruvate kinase [Actinomyces sp. 217892]
MRRAKIVCTLGPATDSPEQVQALVDAGMNVCRINRSHGRAEDQEVLIARVRDAAEASGRSVAILVDLQGPKIRLGTFVNDQKVMLNKGDEFTITTEDVLGTVKRCSTTFKGLPGDCRPGDRLLIDDGNVAVRVTAVTDTDVVTRVEVPGYVSNNKGINLPGVAVSVPALSEKDRDDLRWALRIGADLIALSFVRDANDIADVHEIMDEVGVRIPVIAKIEKPQAVDNLLDIVSAFDGIMVARGDLGVEMPLEAVPLVQKRAIELARRQAKPVIVATQVLESMIQNPRPTRAEASDCANAILDGADAVMLSGETSVGAYPIEAVRTMARIIENVEENGGERIAGLGSYPQTRGGALTRAAAEMGEQLDATYLVTFTQSGDTARRLSRLRSPIPLLAFTPLSTTRNQLSVSWGVSTYETPEVRHTDEMVAQVDEVLQEKSLAQPGDQIIIVAGMPPGTPGSTNSIRVHTVGETGDYRI